MNLDPVEIRVIGCLVEKQRATPDGYPLSLNSLRLACNQSTNRDPVVDYDEAAVRQALGSLGRRRWLRSATGHGGRTLKYRHLLDDALGLPDDQISLLAVLMLRGAQTPGELKQRAERLHPFPDLGAVNDALEGLIERELVARLLRRPGQKEERYEHLLGGEEAEGPGEAGAEAAPGDEAAPGLGEPAAAAAPAPPATGDALEGVQDELAELRRRVAELERRLASISLND
jgi:uncharacterized protein YceH (UPF0502 family)